MTVSSISVLTVVLLGDCFAALRGVGRFRFREGITSSISNGSSESSFLTEPLCANREMEVRVLLRGESAVAFRSLEVSWEILEVRMLKVGHMQVQNAVDVEVDVGWDGMGFVWFLSSR